jgi:phospholipid-transporting ATPase
LNSAVCCRLTPLQKASVVKMFQATGATALAIGDGANDVSMIQEGRVGVGIMGLEGAQAQLAADYAIPRFKHLRRLCMVHGRYSLYRNSFCVLYSFYKNVIIAMMQCYFSFFTGFSAMAVSDTSGWLLSFYNFAFTSLPPLFVGMFEKDLPEEALMQDPTLYKPLAQGMYFDAKSTAMWFGESVLHSLCLFFLMFPAYQRSELKDGKIMDVYMLSTILVSATVCLVLGRLAVNIRYWIVVHVGSIGVSFAFYFLFLVIYAAIPILFGDSHFYYTAYMLFEDPKFWLSILLLSVGLLVPLDVAGIHLQKALFPTSRDIAQLQYAEVAEKARLHLSRTMSEIQKRQKEDKLREQSSSGFK